MRENPITKKFTYVEKLESPIRYAFGKNYEIIKLLMNNLDDIGFLNELLMLAIDNNDLVYFDQLVNDKKFSGVIVAPVLLRHIYNSKNPEKLQQIINLLTNKNILFLNYEDELIYALEYAIVLKDRDLLVTLLLGARNNPLTIAQTNNIIKLANEGNFKDIKEILNPDKEYLVKDFFENPEYEFNGSELNLIILEAIEDKDAETLNLLLEDRRMSKVLITSKMLNEIFDSEDEKARYDMIVVLLKHARHFLNINDSLMNILISAAMRHDNDVIDLILSDVRLNITDEERIVLKNYSDNRDYPEFFEYLRLLEKY
jgi:hypothetical protein